MTKVSTKVNSKLMVLTTAFKQLFQCKKLQYFLMESKSNLPHIPEDLNNAQATDIKDTNECCVPQEVPYRTSSGWRQA